MSSRRAREGRCAACSHEIEGFYDEDTLDWAVVAGVCDGCAREFPESLLKAVGDEFDYALGLRDGTVIRFARAAITGPAFVRLNDIRQVDYADVARTPYSFDRGIDVRISEIAWCCDAPQGS
jgi:hypothetical protein